MDFNLRISFFFSVVNKSFNFIVPIVCSLVTSKFHNSLKLNGFPSLSNDEKIIFSIRLLSYLSFLYIIIEVDNIPSFGVTILSINIV
jgi:hypothetical protein